MIEAEKYFEKQNTLRCQMQKFQSQSYLCDISLRVTLCMMADMHASYTFYYDISSKVCLNCFHPWQEVWMQKYLFTRNDCTGFMRYILPSITTCYWSNKLHTHFLHLNLFDTAPHPLKPAVSSQPFGPCQHLHCYPRCYITPAQKSVVADNLDLGPGPISQTVYDPNLDKQWSNQGANLHMPRQLYCRDMCKSITRLRMDHKNKC